jgi:membrane associated rhomboid family serine protease
MFPIRDSQPTQRVPVVTWMLIVGTLAAFVYQLALDDARFNELVYLCGIVPARWLDPWRA